MSLTGSIVGALMALVPAAKRALIGEDRWEEGLSRDQLLNYVALLNRSRAELIEHIEIMQRSLDDERRVTHLWREETLRLRGEVERLNEGAHRCQHQADLNRAFAPQQAMQNLAYSQQAQNLAQLAGLGLQNAQVIPGVIPGVACHLPLEDCGMRQAEMVNRLNAQRG